MLDHHLANAALAIVYFASAAIFTLEQAFAHAICAAAAGLIYAGLSRRIGATRTGKAE